MVYLDGERWTCVGLSLRTFAAQYPRQARLRYLGGGREDGGHDGRQQVEVQVEEGGVAHTPQVPADGCQGGCCGYDERESMEERVCIIMSMCL